MIEVESLREELEDIADAAFMLQVERDVEAGIRKGEYVPSELVDRLLAGKEHRLRVWREHRGLTMQLLEAKSRITQSYISEIETGKKPGSIATMKALAEALELTIDDLAR